MGIHKGKREDVSKSNTNAPESISRDNTHTSPKSASWVNSVHPVRF